MWNYVQQYVIALLIFILLRSILYFFHRYVIGYVRTIIHKWYHNFGIVILECLHNIPRYFYSVLSIYFPLKVLDFPPLADKTIFILFTIVWGIQLIQIANKVISYALKNVFSESSDGETFDQNSEAIIDLSVKTLLWIIGFVFILISLDVDVTPLIAGLWVWWIAVWFALQHVLWDIFSSLTIFFDRPFKVGDFVVLWKDKWTVTDVSLKSTRIRTLAWQQLIIPNSAVVNERINNYSDIFRRRTELNLWVTYEIHADTLEKIPMLVEDIVSWFEEATFNWAVFKKFWEFSLNFEVVYYVQTSTYKEYLELNQKVQFAIFRTFEKEWISFAYPTQRIVLDKKE